MSNTEPFDADNELDEQIEEAEANEFEAFDDFWAEVQRKEAEERTGPETVTIRDVTVKVPHDLPLRFELKTDRLKKSGSIEAFKELLADLFGADVLDAWVEAGMTEREFQTVLAWGMANGKGKPVTFREAYELVREKAEGKAETSSTRKNAASGATGGRSRRTSGASTASHRKR